MAGTETMGRGTGTTEAAGRPSGPAAAAFYAAGIGAVVLGIMTVLAEASEDIKGTLEFSKPVGALSGKTIIALVAWVVSWLILRPILKDKEVPAKTIAWVTAVLVVIGLALTFPPIFLLFAAEE